MSVEQIFATAVLLICVMGISDPRNMQPPTGLFPICIGFCVMGMSMSYSLNCGNAMNPARDLSPRLFTVIAGWNLDPLRYVYIFMHECNFLTVFLSA
jgi:glycerol uptake facilitator-like aquaporin